MSLPPPFYRPFSLGVILSQALTAAAVSALGISATDDDELREITATLDPTDSGRVLYGPFVGVCALKLRARTSASQAAEVDAAFRLFTGGNACADGDDGLISLVHLRRVARDLNEPVDDALLKDMILEANGGQGASRGVRRDEFERVMKRAGVFT